ncbi:glutaminase A [Parafrankia colletiae]|uniref:Glutaminase n=1 Tax=Parafrankia colletiae TaxID=573497 RepID=A0A1S1Q756_9ACTN|nr:glutaminase A [Parafrankia colletiae]MCK9902288.1 glutaminase A [Frankia sp. Cpl3]OHV29409.1 glutaminase A [Parafrankia colletiae]
MEKVLADIHKAFSADSSGAVARYIPELATADPSLFGLAVTTMDGLHYQAGDSHVPFTIQSVSKPFVYALALRDRGTENVLARVGVEPTGDAFNAITLEPASGRPLNPMVNAGAILTSSLVRGADPGERFDRILAGLSAFAGRQLTVNERVFASERDTGDRNRAIGFLMRGAGALHGPVDEICDVYFRQCAVEVTAADLAVMAGTLARGGINPRTGERVLDEDHVNHVLTVMATCGMYDRAGTWLFRVGLPAKSGVAGGVCAVLPGQLGIGVFSPPLDEAGNSYRGVRACEMLASRFALHLLAPQGEPPHPVRGTHRGDALSSKRLRGARERAVLARRGAAIVIHELQGDLGFASAERVVRTVRENQAGSRWVLLDLRRVAAVREPAVELIRVMVDDLATRGISVLFADPRGLPGVERLMRGMANTSRLPDLETALEQAEEALLAGAALVTPPPTAHVDLGAQELLADLGPEEISTVAAACERRAYDGGVTVFDEGEPADALFFVTRGLVDALAPNSDGSRWFRLSSIPAGSAFGELALVDGGRRSTRTVVAQAAICEVLTATAFEELRRTCPDVYNALVRAIARSLSSQLRQATLEIQSLEE